VEVGLRFPVHTKASQPLWHAVRVRVSCVCVVCWKER
jgi:hypothetical protein